MEISAMAPEMVFHKDFRVNSPEMYQEFMDQWLAVRDQWLDSKTAKSCSASTRRTYMTAIDSLWVFLKMTPEMLASANRRTQYEADMAAKGFPAAQYRAPWTISPSDAVSYRLWLEKGHKPATTAHYIAVASSLFQFIGESTTFDSATGIERSLFFDARGVQRSNPFLNAAMTRPKVDPYNKAQAIDHDLVNKFFDAIRQDRDPISRARDLALFRAYLLTGRRATEIVTMRWGDIRRVDDENYEFRYVGKGKGRGRGEDATWDRLPLPLDVYEGIVDYLKAVGRWPIKGNEYIFQPLCDDGLDNFTNVDRSKLEANRHIASRRVGQLMDKITERAGMERLHPHQLRHTFAINCYLATGDIRLVQRLLGHAHINTTEIYLGKLQIKRDDYSKKLIAQMGFRV